MTGDPPGLVLAAGRGQFELNVVGIADRQDVNAESLAKVRDLAVGYAALIGETHGTFQRSSVGDGKTEVIEADPGLVKPVTARGASGVGAGTDAHPNGAIAQEDAGWQVGDVLEAEDLGVERLAARDIADRKPEVMDGTRGNRHGDGLPAFSFLDIASL
jgi:hypothetical protein